MLILGRYQGQKIVVCDEDGNELLTIVAHEIRRSKGKHGDTVKIGIEAPRSLPVYRLEILEQIREEAKAKAVIHQVPHKHPDRRQARKPQPAKTG